MNFVAVFFAGAFLCNAVPHLTAALRGEVFPTPFAKPPTWGPSTPLVNLVWGATNLVLGLILIGFYPVAIGLNPEFAVLLAGAFLMGLRLSTHFGDARRKGTFTGEDKNGTLGS